MMLSPWSCQCPLSVARVCIYTRSDPVRGFSRITLIMSEPTVSCRSPHVYSPWSLSGLTVDYQNLVMCFTHCHYNHDFRTIYTWNSISQFSLNCIPIINHQSIIYYILEQLHVLIVNYRLRIPHCFNICFPISTIDSVDPVHMYSQDLFLYLRWDTFPLFKLITMCTYYNVRSVCTKWCSANSGLYPLQIPHGRNCHPPSCRMNPLLQL